MHRRGLRPLIACFTLAIACGDTNTGTASATGSTSTGATTSTSTTTSTDTSTSAAPTTSSSSSSSASASGSSSSGDLPTTGAVDTTTTSTATTADPSTSTGPIDTSTSTSTTGGPDTSSSSGGNIEPPPPPMMPAGCGFCDCCDPWPISWAAVPEATHYVVRWKCSINPEQVHDVGNKTAIADVCNDIDMCNGMCAFTVGYIKVQACNDDGCSALVNIPADQSPITCGGGCCC